LSPTLNIIRRVCIFLVFLGLVINGLFLIMANQANATRAEQTDATYTLRVRFDDKAAAEALAAALKKEKSEVSPQTSLTTEKTSKEVSNGKYFVGLVMDAQTVESIAQAMKTQHLATFSSKSEAQAQAAAARARLSGVINLGVIEGHRTVNVNSYVVVVTVHDEASLDGVRQYVESKTSAATIEP
jgi:Flp pilus assembly secretin CpaC